VYDHDDDEGGDRMDESKNLYQDNHGGEHPALSRGLKSSRAGFSIEELDAMRKVKFVSRQGNGEQMLDEFGRQVV